MKRNIFRVTQGKNLNVGHLASLSTDAIPALVEAYRTPEISGTTREGIGAILLCYINRTKTLLSNLTDWRSFNYSRWESLSIIGRNTASINWVSYKRTWKFFTRADSKQCTV